MYLDILQSHCNTACQLVAALAALCQLCSNEAAHVQLATFSLLQLQLNLVLTYLYVFLLTA